MSLDPTPSFKVQYADNFDLLYQQLAAATIEAVRVKRNVVGTRCSFETVGSGSAVQITSRHSDTEYISLPHGKRWANIEFWTANELIDEEDEARMINTPESPYVMALAGSLARKTDEMVLSAAVGTATTGTDETTTGTQALPSAQKIAVASAGLTLAKLRTANRILDAAEVPKSDRHIFVSARQIEDVLGDSTITSADYNSVRLLMNGDIDQFMGMRWHHSERLGTDSNGDRQVTLLHRFAMGLAFAIDPVRRLDRLATKNYALQIYNKQGLGAVRIQDTGVVEIACDEP